MRQSPPRSKNLGFLSLGIMALAVIMAFPMTAGASSFSAGYSVTHRGETIQNDLYVAAFRAKILADVQGDLSLASVTATVDSTIGGSVHVIAGTATIRGDIRGSLYVVGGIARLDGTVRGNVVVTGGKLEFKNNARIGGDLIINGVQAQIDGTVDGKLYGSTIIYDQNGSVSGNVELQSDRIELGPQAHVGDDFRYQSPSDAGITGSANIEGETVHTDVSPWNGVGDGAMSPYGMFARLVWIMLAGAVLIAIMPRLFYRAAANGANVPTAGIWGILGLILIPLFAILALLTVFLIPVGLLMLAIFPMLLYLSQVVVSIIIGRSILPKSWRDGSRGFLLFAMVIGSVLIGLLKLAPVPFLSSITLLLVTIWGLGALLLSLRDMSSASTRASMS